MSSGPMILQPVFDKSSRRPSPLVSPMRTSDVGDGRIKRHSLSVYVRPPVIGAVIENISSQDQTVLSHFIDEVNTMNLMGF
jgi:hypothetical protein